MSKQSNIKNKIKEQYGTIALADGSLSCCSSSAGCCGTSETVVVSPIESSKTVGYHQKDLKSIPQSSILGLGCGNPSTFAHLKDGDIVVDLGSGAGIDVFIAANIVKDKGRVIGIDLTDAMLEKARKNAQIHGYQNVEFRKGDIEEKIPVEDNSVDVVISNCVINLTEDKVSTFKEIHRILKPNGVGKLIISDVVTSREVEKALINEANWCGCIDGALTKENYLDSIKRAGFTNVEILEERPGNVVKDYAEDIEKKTRTITSITVKAFKN
ncbi:arsenite methyltransferase [Candidatus Nitrosocosmicus hydrocola]|uniref:arsenite methyltransferase n=1 Tax=Candidatus Nitrosocosmicus hydrocola TaxID=1826872 RepID=UPI001372C2AA|nr:arsenite methyltransferase [Candidatus Nitrosocosmicus hydrocola]